ncbi:hypothetical protein N7481_008709 [Penicillium waksmanii]|uniref:uncharacterized protein n=1 Tax=Penicillium waksmanii TaxID=69791 RepID=UPI00254734A9|nr:uncharacterized protein N7481_008709 [Penicillium waksmanii]KAJ5975002.1 hypothetical protein N7481_008709 [Penicillium waksmanii]
MLGWVIIPLYEAADALLDQCGSFNSIQKLRLSMIRYHARHDSNVVKRKIYQNFPELWSIAVFNLIESDLRLRELTQREEVIRQQYQAIKFLSPENRREAHMKYPQLLDSISKEYWEEERSYYYLEASLLNGPVTRAYSKNRENPRWYLHKDLRNDCAGKGGCCGRGCGCCENREIIPGRMKGVGHCTSECGCCIQNRDFELTPEEEEKLVKIRFDTLNDDRNRTYRRRLLEAFLSGVESKKKAAPTWRG